MDPASEEGGYIIQEITALGGMLHYWEAWHVTEGQQYTEKVDPKLANISADDKWSNRGVSANATFYEGLQKLPDLFRAYGQFGHVPQSGDLPSTDSDPSSKLPSDHSNVVTRTFP
jgi:hypothetical protein